MFLNGTLPCAGVGFGNEPPLAALNMLLASRPLAPIGAALGTLGPPAPAPPANWLSALGPILRPELALPNVRPALATAIQPPAPNQEALLLELNRRFLVATAQMKASGSAALAIQQVSDLLNNQLMQPDGLASSLGAAGLNSLGGSPIDNAAQNLSLLNSLLASQLLNKLDKSGLAAPLAAGSLPDAANDKPVAASANGAGELLTRLVQEREKGLMQQRLKKSNVKWNVAHVRIAWQIHSYQQRQQHLQKFCPSASGAKGAASSGKIGHPVAAAADAPSTTARHPAAKRPHRVASDEHKHKRSRSRSPQLARSRDSAFKDDRALASTADNSDKENTADTQRAEEGSAKASSATAECDVTEEGAASPAAGGADSDGRTPEPSGQVAGDVLDLSTTQPC